MDDIDISREAVQTALKQFAMQLLSDYGVAGDIPRNDPDFSNCLFAEADAICSIFRAALDRAEAAVGGHFNAGYAAGMSRLWSHTDEAADDYLAAIRALPNPPALPASPDVQALVEAERERCARKRVFAPPEAPRGLDYYTFKRGWDAGITAKNAALRTGAKP
jgi:hypothetical protein